MLIDPVFEKNIPGNLDNCINGNHDCDFWLAKTSGWGTDTAWSGRIPVISFDHGGLRLSSLNKS
jgi:hypothetical protein